MGMTGASSAPGNGSWPGSGVPSHTAPTSANVSEPSFHSRASFSHVLALYAGYYSSAIEMEGSIIAHQSFHVLSPQRINDNAIPGMSEVVTKGLRHL